MMRYLISFIVSFLILVSIVFAETKRTVYNPWTGRLDFVTELSTSTIQSGSGICVSTSTSGLVISLGNCDGSGGSSSGNVVLLEDGGAPPEPPEEIITYALLEDASFILLEDSGKMELEGS